MKQRLIKVIVCACLAVSVFLCSGGTALARPITDEDFTGSVTVHGEGWIYLDNVSLGNISPGSSTYSSYGKVSGSNNYFVRFNGLEVGRTYSGYVTISMTLEQEYPHTTGNVTWSNYSVSAREVSDWDGISMSVFTFMTQSASNKTSTKGYINIYFNNWYNDIGTTFDYGFVLDVEHAFYTNDGSLAYGEYLYANGGVDWAGTLFQRLPEGGSQLELDAIQDQSAMQQQISQQQMQQHQQIANQQSQQSAQQHEDLKSGFTDDTYNSHVSSAGSQIDSYISQESALMDQQQNRVQDFAADNFNTGLINAYMPAIAAVSGWYTQLWNAFGQFNGAFVAILSLGVAALIIGLRRR